MRKNMCVKSTLFSLFFNLFFSIFCVIHLNLTYGENCIGPSINISRSQTYIFYTLFWILNRESFPQLFSCFPDIFFHWFSIKIKNETEQIVQLGFKLAFECIVKLFFSKWSFFLAVLSWPGFLLFVRSIWITLNSDPMGFGGLA